MYIALLSRHVMFFRAHIPSPYFPCFVRASYSWLFFFPYCYCHESSIQRVRCCSHEHSFVESHVRLGWP